MQLFEDIYNGVDDAYFRPTVAPTYSRHQIMMTMHELMKASLVVGLFPWRLKGDILIGFCWWVSKAIVWMRIVCGEWRRCLSTAPIRVSNGILVASVSMAFPTRCCYFNGVDDTSKSLAKVVTYEKKRYHQDLIVTAQFSNCILYDFF